MLHLDWVFITSLIASLRIPSPFSGSTGSAEIPCIHNTSLTTVQNLIACYNPFTVPENFYNQETYDAAQPNEAELTAWLGLVNELLWVDGNCTEVLVPPVLDGIYGVSPFQARTTSYCVLHERKADKSAYVKGWGVMVVPEHRSSRIRNIHLAAPHPQFDYQTPEQAAALLEGVGARSLLIPGRKRTSFNTATDCVQPGGNTTTVYYVTDPAHNDKEPFIKANIQIAQWQHTQEGGCPGSSCAFIQLHGKADSSCREDTMFLSSGLARSASSVAWYTDSTDRPVKRLQKNIREAFPFFNASLPSDSFCGLTATTNVFGRYLNGIPESMVCQKGSTAPLASGEFVHIEQAPVSVNSDAYEGWIKALSETFPITA
ncbi:hypothetical protein L218DRAFT_934164 [Marasmius fiardii PR-910]|nr:hypothetical protein L218DRAFT_934164 [Marasmius fiardii PR-910]